MQETILVYGYGPGISGAVANKFGGEGFQVALVARNADKLDKAQRTLQARGVQATAFPADLSGANAAKRLVTRVTPAWACHGNSLERLCQDCRKRYGRRRCARARVRRGRHEPGLNPAAGARRSEGGEGSAAGGWGLETQAHRPL